MVSNYECMDRIRDIAMVYVGCVMSDQLRD